MKEQFIVALFPDVQASAISLVTDWSELTGVSWLLVSATPERLIIQSEQHLEAGVIETLVRMIEARPEVDYIDPDGLMFPVPEGG